MTLTDTDLTQLLTEAADSFPVPDPGSLAAPARRTGRPFYQRRWVQLGAAAAVIVGAFTVLSGPGHRSTPAALSTGALPFARLAHNVAPGVAVGGGGVSSGKDLAAGGGVASGSGAGSSPLVGVAAGTAEAPPQFVPPPGNSSSAAIGAPLSAPAVSAGAADGARIVKSGEIALVVKNGAVTPTLTAVGDAATAAGGYISASQTDEYGSSPSGTVTLRVPVGKFDSVVARIRSLNAKVRTASLSGRDVTADYTDLQAQLSTLKAARGRFLDLLAKATTIGDILSVQQRVDDLTGQIDRLEGQRRVLASQSDLATLAVTVTQADDPIVTPLSKRHSGLVQAFIDAKDGFVTGVEALIRRSGRALLVLICLGVLLLVARQGWRLVRRRMV